MCPSSRLTDRVRTLDGPTPPSHPECSPVRRPLRQPDAHTVDLRKNPSACGHAAPVGLLQRDVQYPRQISPGTPAFMRRASRGTPLHTPPLLVLTPCSALGLGCGLSGWRLPAWAHELLREAGDFACGTCWEDESPSEGGGGCLSRYGAPGSQCGVAGTQYAAQRAILLSHTDYAGPICERRETCVRRLAGIGGTHVSEYMARRTMA